MVALATETLIPGAGRVALIPRLRQPSHTCRAVIWRLRSLMQPVTPGWKVRSHRLSEDRQTASVCERLRAQQFGEQRRLAEASSLSSYFFALMLLNFDPASSALPYWCRLLMTERNFSIIAGLPSCGKRLFVNRPLPFLLFFPPPNRRPSKYQSRLEDRRSQSIRRSPTVHQIRGHT
jgi:hypothetical protein